MCLHSQASQSPKIPLSSCSLRINLGAGTLTAAFCGSRHSRVATVERGQPTTWPKWSLVPRLPTFNRQKMTKDDKSTYESYEQISGMSRYERHRASLCSAELFTFHMFSIVLACLGHGQARPSDAKHHNHKAKNERPAQRSLGRLRWRSGIKVGKLLQHGVRIIAQPSQADIFKRLHSSIL